MTKASHRLMVLGSLDEFVQLVCMARSRGIYVIVCDGYADGPAKTWADSAYTIDVRDTHAIAQLCVRERVDAVISSFSDVLAENLAAVAQLAGLPASLTPKRLRYLRDKSLMRGMFDELGIAHPASVEVRRGSEAADLARLSFPIVTKPADAYGSHGVYLLDTPAEVLARFDEVASYSDADFILAEEYDDGYEFNMMCWVVDGEPVVLEIADREKTAEVAYVTPHVSRIVYPSRLTSEVLGEARSVVARVARYVGLEDGPLCMQFFWSADRCLRVCECAGRIFGYEHELLQLASERLSVEELLLDNAYDHPALVRRLASHSPYLPRVAAGLYFHGYEGTIAAIEGVPDETEPGVEEVLVYYQVGDEIRHGVGVKPYVVRIYLSGETYEQVDELSERLFRKIHVLDSAGRDLLYHNEITSYESRGRTEKHR